MQIAFTLTGLGEIWLLRADGSQRVLARNAAHPAWSPDGRAIAFERAAPQGDPFSAIWTDDIWVVHADGTGLRRLTSSPMTENEPAWSPDGRKIIFTRDPGYELPEIWVMNADGSAKRRLTRDANRDDDPAWSPDGSKIAFASSALDSFIDSNIYVMQADGSGRRLLASGHGEHFGLYEPGWSPDGTRIVFAQDDEIWIMNADGSDRRRLTEVADYSWADKEPDWSPDGRWIVFEREGSDSDYKWSGVLLVRPDGTDLRRLIGPEADDPKWRPPPRSR